MSSRARVSASLSGRACGPNGFGKRCQNRRINLIRLGQLSGGFGKITGLARINDGDRQTCAGQLSRDTHFQSARGFHHDQGRRLLSDCLTIWRNARLIVSNMHRLSIAGSMHTSNVDLDTSMPTNFSTIVSFMAPILAKMRAYWPKQPFGLVSEKSARRSLLPHGLDVPRANRAAEPGQTELFINSFMSGKTKHTRGKTPFQRVEIIDFRVGRPSFEQVCGRRD